jgi:hypothetical protein
LTSEEKDTEPDIDWTGLKPSERDGYQLYVFVAHVLVGAIVSVLSFNGDFASWGLGTGVLPPVLLSITGLGYLVPTGVNWYRDEFLPFVNRITVIPEHECERFLKYQRINRFIVLVAGYLATGISQIIWTQTIAFFSPFWVNLPSPSDPLDGLFAGVVILFIFIWLMLMAFFELFLRPGNDDINRLFDLDLKMVQATKKTSNNQEDQL